MDISIFGPQSESHIQCSTSHLAGGWTTHFKNISQIRLFPQIGMKIKKHVKLPSKQLSSGTQVACFTLKIGMEIKTNWIHHHLFT